jgi:hypothetical protein
MGYGDRSSCSIRSVISGANAVFAVVMGAISDGVAEANGNIIGLRRHDYGEA